MAHQPADRYPTPRALADDLEHWLADEPVSVYREPLSTRLTRWGRQHREAAVAIGCLLVTAIGGLTVGALLLSQAKSQTEAQKKLAIEKSEEATRSASSLASQLVINRLNLAHRECLDNNVTRAETLLEACPPESRGWEWHYLKQLCHQEVATMLGHRRIITSLSFRGDGAWLVSGGGRPYSEPQASDRGELIVWDVAERRLLFHHDEIPGTVTSVAYSPDQKTVAAGSGYYEGPFVYGGVRLWDPVANRVVFQSEPIDQVVLSVAFSPDGSLLAAGCGRHSNDFPGKLLVWELPSQKLLFEGESEKGGINSLEFRPDGRQLALATSGAIELWDVEKRSRNRVLRGHENWVYDLAYRPDGLALASGGIDRTLRIWNLAREEPAIVIDRLPGPVSGVAFSPDGQRLASAAGTVDFWDARTGRFLYSQRGHENAGIAGISDVAYSPDGRSLATSSVDRSIRLWDASFDQNQFLGQHGGWVTCMVPLPGGKLLTGSGDKRIRRWDLSQGRLEAQIEAHKDWVLCLDVSPDGRLAASGGADFQVMIWDGQTLEPVRKLSSPDGYVSSVLFSHDGRTLFSGASAPPSQRERKGDVRAWNVASGELERVLVSEHHVEGMALHPDGTTLAVAVGRRSGEENEACAILLVDVVSGRELRRLSGHQGSIKSVAFSPDGTILVSVGADDLVHVWEPDSGREIRRLAGHAEDLSAVLFSPDGSRLFTGGFDSEVKIWNTRTWEEVLSIRSLSGGVVSLGMDQQNNTLLAGTTEQRVLLWHTVPPEIDPTQPPLAESQQNPYP
jgi:WD40 repeat protein